MTTRERLHVLVDSLTDSEVAELLHFAEEHAGGSYVCPHCGALEHVPNEETEQALRDSEAGVGVTRHANASELFKSLGL